MKIFKSTIVFAILLPSIYVSGETPPSLPFKKNNPFRLEQTFTLDTRVETLAINSTNPSNPNGTWVELDEQKNTLVPEVEFVYKKGIDASFKGRAMGVFINDSVSRPYLNELYYRKNAGGINVVLGKYISVLDASYFDNPADLLLENKESKELQGYVDKDYKTGNVTLKISRYVGDYLFEGIAADYKDEDFFGDDIDETQYILKFGSLLFNQSVDATVSTRTTSGGENAVGLIVSADAGESATVYFQASSTVQNKRVNAYQITSDASPVPGIYAFQFSKTQAYASSVVGVQYTSSAHSWTIIFEYFYTQAGYDNDEAATIKNALIQANKNDAYKDPRFKTPDNPFAGVIKQNLKRLALGNYRRNYVKNRFSSGDIFDDFEITSIVSYNVDDRSFFSKITAEKTTDHLIANLYATAFDGVEFSEYGMFPYKNAYGVSLKLIF